MLQFGGVTVRKEDGQFILRDVLGNCVGNIRFEMGDVVSLFGDEARMLIRLGMPQTAFQLAASERPEESAMQQYRKEPFYPAFIAMQGRLDEAASRCPIKAGDRVQHRGPFAQTQERTVAEIVVFADRAGQLHPFIAFDLLERGWFIYDPDGDDILTVNGVPRNPAPPSHS